MKKAPSLQVKPHRSTTNLKMLSLRDKIQLWKMRKEYERAQRKTMKEESQKAKGYKDKNYRKLTHEAIRVLSLYLYWGLKSLALPPTVLSQIELLCIKIVMLPEIREVDLNETHLIVGGLAISAATVMHPVVATGNDKLVRAFIALGADPNKENSLKENAGHTVLRVAQTFVNEENAYVRRIPPDARDRMLQKYDLVLQTLLDNGLIVDDKLRQYAATLQTHRQTCELIKLKAPTEGFDPCS